MNNQELDELGARILTMCQRRGWSLHWTARGAYLHLESSELIEAVRGKRGAVLGEAADVLLVLASITENAGIPFSEVVQRAAETRLRLPLSPSWSSYFLLYPRTLRLFGPYWLRTKQYQNGYKKGGGLS